MRVCVITATLQIRRLETGVWDNFLRSHSQLEIGPEQNYGYPGVFVFFFFSLSKKCLISSRYIYSQNACVFAEAHDSGLLVQEMADGSWESCERSHHYLCSLTASLGQPCGFSASQFLPL